MAHGQARVRCKPRSAGRKAFSSGLPKNSGEGQSLHTSWTASLTPRRVCVTYARPLVRRYRAALLSCCRGRSDLDMISVR